MGASPPPRKAPGRTPSSDEGRATIVPSFDPESFARDSEVKLRAVQSHGSEPTIEQARRLHQSGQHEDALFLLTRLLDLAPLHPEGTALSNECRQALERECLAAVGSEAAVLTVSVSGEELRRFTLDNVSGFLLSLMDGATSVETILDLSSLPRLLALRHLRGLLDRGIVAVSSSRRPR